MWASMGEELWLQATLSWDKVYEKLKSSLIINAIVISLCLFVFLTLNWTYVQQDLFVSPSSELISLYDNIEVVKLSIDMVFIQGTLYALYFMKLEKLKYTIIRYTNYVQCRYLFTRCL